MQVIIHPKDDDKAPGGDTSAKAPPPSSAIDEETAPPAPAEPTATAAGAADQLPTRDEYIALCRKRMTEGDSEQTAENHYRIGWCHLLDKGNELALQQATEAFDAAFKSHPKARYLQMRITCDMIAGVPQESVAQRFNELIRIDRRYQYFGIETIHPEVSYFVMLLSDADFAEQAGQALQKMPVDSKAAQAVFMHLRDPQYHCLWDITAANGLQKRESPELAALTKCANRCGTEGLRITRALKDRVRRRSESLPIDVSDTRGEYLVSVEKLVERIHRDLSLKEAQ